MCENRHFHMMEPYLPMSCVNLMRHCAVCALSLRWHVSRVLTGGYTAAPARTVSLLIGSKTAGAGQRYQGTDNN